MKATIYINLEELTVEYLGPVKQVAGVSQTELSDPLSLTTQTIHPDDQIEATEAFEALLSGERSHLDIEYRTHPDEDGTPRHRGYDLTAGR